MNGKEALMKTKITRATMIHFESNNKTNNKGESKQESKKKKKKHPILIYTH